ncbi:MAG: tetratricopeptide repeat protein [Gemmatimonadota bacterium]|nr:MAG: tetratricopeptide repeat protein [Gemmatimonadota bacterium]
MTEKILLSTVIVVVVFLILVLVWFLFRKQRPGKKKTPYIEALNAIISGDMKTALQKLRETVHIDSHNVDAYLKLGNLLRQSGDIERALKVHKSLTVRPLSSRQRTEVLKALACDYLEARKFDKARSSVQEILSQERKELWALETLLSIHEETSEWDDACDTLKQIQKLQGQRDDVLLALYKVCAGKTLDEKGDHHRARLKYKEALRIDARCTPAYLSLGDSYVSEQRLTDAIGYWKKLIEVTPEHAFLTFERLEKAHFELGDFGSMVRIYQDLINRRPNDLRALFAFVRIKEKMGDVDEALALCHQALEKEPQCLDAQWCLVKCYHARGDDARAIEYALNLEKEFKRKQPFRCSQCGFQSQEPLWRCPQCKQWRTFV